MVIREGRALTPALSREREREPDSVRGAGAASLPLPRAGEGRGEGGGVPSGILRRSFLAATPFPFTACSPKTNQRTLRFWGMGREAEVVGELLPQFLKERQGLTVQIEQLPWTAAHEKLLTAFAGDATPDIAQLGNSWIPELAALKALEPLEPLLKAEGSIVATDYFPGIWNTNSVDGTLYGVPWYVDTRLMFYRRDLFAKAGITAPPKSWAELVAALDALQRCGIAHPLLLPLNEFEPLLALALQQPDDLLRDGGRFGNFRSPGFRRALRFYHERFLRGHAQPVTNVQISNLWQEFGRGVFAAFVSGPWNIGELDRRLGPDRRGDWATAPLPGPTGPGVSTAGGSSLVIFKRSSLKDDALALMAFLARPATQLHFHAVTGDLPPRRGAWAMQSGDAPPLFREPRAVAFANQLERVRPAPGVPEWERIVQEMQTLANRVVQQGLSEDDAVTQLDARVDGFLEKRRWMLGRA